MGHKHAEVLHELQQTKQALAASEKRGRRAVTRLRELEKVLAPLLDKMRTWSTMPVSDDTNASRVMTVGQCRKLVALLDAGAGEEEHAPVSETDR